MGVLEPEVDIRISCDSPEFECNSVFSGPAEDVLQDFMKTESGLYYCLECYLKCSRDVTFERSSRSIVAERESALSKLSV